MNIAELRAELEEDRAWRDKEIREFQNRGSAISDEEGQKRYRRALVLLLYAHYEGFCKFAFTLYTNAINSADITCGEASYAVAAASLADMFKDLGNPQRSRTSFGANSRMISNCIGLPAKESLLSELLRLITIR